jgi:hypothetical protein
VTAVRQFTDEERAAIAVAAAAQGDLRPYMTRTQRIAHKLYLAVRALVTIFVVDCSRRFGKTYFDAMEVHMEAMKGPKRTIRYVAPTKLHGRQFVIPAFDWVFERVPEKHRPKFVLVDTTWIWPNGSVCHLGSAETMGDVEAQVGTPCHLAILDEAGKMRSDLLKHLILSVLLPQLLTTGGNIMVTSTPALVQAHYLSSLVAAADVGGALIRFTIDDCDHIPQEARTRLIMDALEITEPTARDTFKAAFEALTTTADRVRFIREKGGPNRTIVLRELYCIQTTETSRMLVPEWIDVADVCTKPAKLPDYVHWYVIGDFGFEDMTVIGFLYFDFARSRLVMADELAFQGASGLQVGYAIKAKEEQLGIVKPKRFADATPQLLSDIADDKLGPGITFGPVMKDDSDAALNALRMRIAKCHVEIDPKCKVTISHLMNGIWNARRTDFERMDGFGHFDAIDMLKYAVRQVDWNRNPNPIILPNVSAQTHHIPHELAEQMRRSRETLRAFNGRS